MKMEKPHGSPSLAEIVRFFEPEFRKAHGERLLPIQSKALRAICRCRTPALGGERYRCKKCGHQHFVYHACRNRHCPKCQKRNQQDWLKKRLHELLPIPYFHITFTLPHELSSALLSAPKKGYGILFRCASQTLQEFARNKLEAKLGVIAVLHTWDQKLNYHPHLHCIVTAGGFNADSDRWIESKPSYLFPVQALRIVFKAKVLHALGKDPSMPQPDPVQIAKAKAKTWGIDIQPPRGDPRALILYLARYIYRVAIDERRLESIDPHNSTVSFHFRNRRENNRDELLTLDGSEFLRRFTLHVLPKGLVKVRYYGIL